MGAGYGRNKNIARSEAASVLISDWNEITDNESVQNEPTEQMSEGIQNGMSPNYGMTSPTYSEYTNSWSPRYSFYTQLGTSQTISLAHSATTSRSASPSPLNIEEQG